MPDNDFFHFGESEEYEEAVRLDAQEKARVQQAYANVFGSEDGEIVLADILSSSGYFMTAFTGNSKTYYNEGQKDLVSQIMDKVLLTAPKTFGSIYKARFNKLKGDNEHE